jgi:hypothetical protein
MENKIYKTCKNCGHKKGDYCMLAGISLVVERRCNSKCDKSFSGWIPRIKIGLKKRLLMFWYGNV